MADLSRDPNGSESQKSKPKKVYRRPALIKLGGLRDMTMSSTNFGANDGLSKMGTKRGGNFEAADCEG